LNKEKNIISVSYEISIDIKSITEILSNYFFTKLKVVTFLQDLDFFLAFYKKATKSC